MAENKQFRTATTKSSDVIKVDRENESIRGFAVVTKGVVKDERGEMDDAALDTVVDLGNKMKMGAKSRFGHPNMCGTALGTFLGRVKNFRRDGDVVRADLHIDKTAHSAPEYSKDPAAYVLDLAESDPDAFGSSMVIDWDAEFKLDKDGQPMKDQDGNRLPPFIRIQKLYAVDIVDDPAANDGMFDAFTESVQISAEMTAFFNKFLERPDAVDQTIKFLQRYQANREDIDGDEYKTKKEQEGIMSDLTLDEFKTKHGKLYEEVRAEGFSAGEKSERSRAATIAAKAAEFGVAELAEKAIGDGVTVDKAHADFASAKLEALKKAAPVNPGAPEEDAGGQKEDGNDRFAIRLQKAREYQQKNGGSIESALKAVAAKEGK